MELWPLWSMNYNFGGWIEMTIWPDISAAHHPDITILHWFKASSSIWTVRLLMWFRLVTEFLVMPVTVRIYTNQYHTSSQSLLDGQEVEFGCRTEGSKPNAKIEWFFDHQRIVSRETSYYNFSQRKRFDEDTESTTEYPLPDSTRFVSIIVSHRANSTLSLIRFIPSYTDNNKVLSCYVWNPFIVNSKISDMLTLDVKCKHVHCDFSHYHLHHLQTHHWLNLEATFAVTFDLHKSTGPILAMSQCWLVNTCHCWSCTVISNRIPGSNKWCGITIRAQWRPSTTIQPSRNHNHPSLLANCTSAACR